jgi:hypothetical protein
MLGCFYQNWGHPYPLGARKLAAVPIADVQTVLGRDAEPLARKHVDARVGLLQAGCGREDRYLDESRKRCLVPQKGDL